MLEKASEIILYILVTYVRSMLRLKIKWLALQWQTAGLVTLRPLCCSVVFLKLCHLVIDAKGLKKIA